MSRVPAPFRTLQWRLTLTYVVVTVLTVLTLASVLLAGFDVVFVNTPLETYALADQIRPIAAQAASYLSTSQPNTDALELQAQESSDNQYVLATQDGIRVQAAATLLVLMLDARGRVLAAAANDTGILPNNAVSGSSPAGSQEPASGTPMSNMLELRELPQSRAVIQSALSGTTDDNLLERSLSGGKSVVAVPILGTARKIVGAVFLETAVEAVSRTSLLHSRWFVLVPSAILLTLGTIVLTLGAIFVGTIFGLLTSRWLTRRLRVLTGAANAWSQGDFSAVARDSSSDELGQLARHLNSMAEEIEMLLKERQDVAVIEERNRLARDLHDSVKQQVFATAMQLAAAHSLLERHPSDAGAARTHVVEAEALTGQAQRELTALIRELLPVALGDKGLVSALQGYSADWSRQTGIASDLRVQGEQPAPLEVEQAILRVTQEALSNIARHSMATKVDIHLLWQRDGLALSIQDNGQGFDVERAGGKGIGLWSMRQRVSALAGTLQISSSTAGTRISVQVPFGVKRGALSSPSTVSPASPENASDFQSATASVVVDEEAGESPYSMRG